MSDRSPEFDRAQTVALNYLSSAPRTCQQVQDRLAKANTDEDVAADVVTWLVEYGYLDDEAFAYAWVASRGDRKRLSQRALRTELHRKGLHRELIDRVLDAEDPTREEERAYALAAEWWARLARRGLDERTAVSKTAQAVMRRGFAPGVAFDAARHAQLSNEDTGR